MTPTRSTVPLLLAVILALPPLLSGAGPSPAAAQLDRDRGVLPFEPSPWWERLGHTDALLEKERWRKALRAAEALSSEIVRRSWREPDLPQVLAAVAIRRAVAEAALGREADALWSWHTARNLDPEATPESTGLDLSEASPAVELFRSHPLREPGRLPDGSSPPQAPLPGYEPPAIEAPEAEEIPFATVQATRVDHPPVLLEVVVDADGGLSHPLVLSSWTEPVPTYWTLETVYEEVGRVRPARLDGVPVATVERIEMRFEDVRRW